MKLGKLARKGLATTTGAISGAKTSLDKYEAYRTRARIAKAENLDSKIRLERKRLELDTLRQKRRQITVSKGW